MILVHADAATAEALANRPDVKRLAANPSVKLSQPAREQLVLETPAAAPTAISAVETGVTKIRANEMWTAGFTGRGIVIGGQDTGYRWTHTAPQGQVSRLERQHCQSQLPLARRHSLRWRLLRRQFGHSVR